MLNVWDSALSNLLFKNSLFIFLVFVVVLVIFLSLWGCLLAYTAHRKKEARYYAVVKQDNATIHLRHSRKIFKVDSCQFGRSAMNE